MIAEPNHGMIDLVARGPPRILGPLLKIFFHPSCFREAMKSMKRNEPVIRVFVIRLFLIFRLYFLSDRPLNTTHVTLPTTNISQYHSVTDSLIWNSPLEPVTFLFTQKNSGPENA